MTGPKTYPRYRRLVISLADLAEARESADRLLQLDEFEAGPYEMTADFKAHLTRLVVAYARPFTTHHQPDLAEKTLSGVAATFDEEEELLHDRICGLRHQEFAHSDPGPAGVSMYIMDDGTVGAVSRVTRIRSVSREETKLARQMIGKLEDAVSLAKQGIEDQLRQELGAESGKTAGE